MEPGTGKTITAFLLVDQKQQKLKRKLRVLVICPKNIIGSWEDEIEKHLTKDYSYTIINYEKARLRIKELRSESWDFIILDECHRIKNRKSKTAKALWTLKAAYKVIMSGTPIPKDEIDLWSQFKFLNPYLWGNNFQDFAEGALKTQDWGEYKTYVPHKKKIKAYLKKAEEFVYRVRLDDVIDLKGQVDVPVMLRLQGKQKKAYYELQDTFLTEQNGKRASIDLSVTSLIRLHQLAGGHLVLENRDTIRYAEQPKLFWLLDKIEDLGTKKLIVFCRYTHEIELIAAALKAKKIGYTVMKGRMTDKETSKVRKQFQQNNKCQVLLGQIQCVKEGNNFQHCNYSVFYSKSLSSIDIDQCKKRTYRNGQKKRCIYWHLIMKDTIDEDYETIVKKKSANAEKILYQLVMKRKKKCQRK